MWWDSNSWRRLGRTDQCTPIMEPTKHPVDGHPDLHFHNGGPQGPDARLIAAAPELLAALRACDVVMDTAAASGVQSILAPAYQESWAKAHAAAREAIAKVEAISHA